jgi:hypothetical protein
MFFHWYGVKAVNTSPLLFAIEAVGPGQTAWEALDYIPIFLMIAIVVTLVVGGLRMTNAVPRPSIPLNALVAALGIVSVLLILYRIVDPPNFGSFPETWGNITIEGTLQLPIFFALFAAAGIALGGYLAVWEEGVGLSGDARVKIETRASFILEDEVVA